MTNVFKFPGLGSPENLDSEEAGVAFYVRLPKIIDLAARTEIAATFDYGVTDTTIPAARPIITRQEILRNQAMRQAVASDMLDQTLKNDTSHADWIAALEQMAKEAADMTGINQDNLGDSHEYDFSA